MAVSVGGEDLQRPGEVGRGRPEAAADSAKRGRPAHSGG